jgi:hypothetical protein
MNKKGILYFHQGWTDIINCLGLINYYCNLYDSIYLIMRNDSKELIDFYTKDIKNIQILYEDKKNIDENGFLFVINKYNNIDLQNCIFLGVGCHDKSRKDQYNAKFRFIDGCFVKGFYESYDIPYIKRIDNFEFTRNYDLEKKTYNNFINLFGTEYILYHEIIEKYDKNKRIVNLNGMSNVFFDYIKILENAIEIHLLDSIWGAFIYQLDAKYKLLQNKKIFLYTKRGYKKMFEEPVKLDNWIII